MNHWPLVAELTLQSHLISMPETFITQEIPRVLGGLYQIPPLHTKSVPPGPLLIPPHKDHGLPLRGMFSRPASSCRVRLERWKGRQSYSPYYFEALHWGSKHVPPAPFPWLNPYIWGAGPSPFLVNKAMSLSSSKHPHGLGLVNW